MQHLIELVTNPWIIAVIVIVFFGEYIPFSRSLWQNISLKMQSLGHWFIQRYEMQLYTQKEEPITAKKVHIRLNNIIARIIFFVISTVVIIFLEIFWELGFKIVTRKLEESGVAAWAQTRIEKMAPWGILVLFGLPFILMELLGVFAMGAFVSGHFFIGIGLYVVKVLFFIPVHFILNVGKDKLLEIAWFKRRYEMIVAVIEWFKQSQSYIKVHNIVQTLKAYINAIKQRFKKTIMLLRKAFEHDDILTSECEEIRKEILQLQKDGLSVETRYKKFFDCIDRHLQGDKNANAQ